MPGCLRAAGLHNVDARIRHRSPGQHRTNPVREDGLDDIDDVGVFLGLDVGKTAHHGHGLTPAGKKVFDKQQTRMRPAVVDHCRPLPDARFQLVEEEERLALRALPARVKSGPL